MAAFKHYNSGCRVEIRQILTDKTRLCDKTPKKLIIGTGGFKIRKRAWLTLQGFESLRMLNKGQFDFWLRRDEPKVVVRERAAFMNRLFNVEVVYQ